MMFRNPESAGGEALDDEALPPLAVADAAAYEEGLALRAAAAREEDGWVERGVEVALQAVHPFPRGEARIALQAAPSEAVVAALLPALTSENRRLRRRAMTLLPRLDSAEIVRQMTAWLPQASREGRRAACVSLAAVGDPALPVLEQLAADPHDAVRRRAARAVAMITERRAAAGSDSAPAEKASDRSNLRPFGLRPPEHGMPSRPPSFALAAFNFSYGVNLGVLIRSAEAAGAEAVWIVGRDFYYRPSTKGSDWWLPVEVVSSPAACVERARAEGYTIVALQQGPAAKLMFELEWPARPLIVVGNEGDGLPDAFVDAADLQVELPVYGRIDSLNVAMAASVAMYAFRAWQAAHAGKEERQPR